MMTVMKYHDGDILTCDLVMSVRLFCFVCGRMWVVTLGFLFVGVGRHPWFVVSFSVLSFRSVYCRRVVRLCDYQCRRPCCVVVCVFL